jgi:hypothetical protein
MRNLGMALIALVGVTASACGLYSSNYGSSGGGTPLPSPSPDGGAENLSVKNYLGWCSVAINGGPPSMNATVTAAVAPGSTATIVATPASSSFQIGSDPWFGVDQNDGAAAPGNDVGTGATESTTATVTIAETGAQCVSVCCQEPGNAPLPCPATNPCH